RGRPRRTQIPERGRAQGAFRPRPPPQARRPDLRACLRVGGRLGAAAARRARKKPADDAAPGERVHRNSPLAVCAIRPNHPTRQPAASSPLQETVAMGRLVRIPREASRTLDPAASGESAAGATAAQPAPANAIEQDDYLLRLAKYVPAEVLAFSILINAILEQALRNGGSAAAMAGIPGMTIAAAAVGARTILSPLFFRYLHATRDGWGGNARAA